jgi:hypothetical protein
MPLRTNPGSARRVGVGSTSRRKPALPASTSHRLMLSPRRLIRPRSMLQTESQRSPPFGGCARSRVLGWSERQCPPAQITNFARARCRSATSHRSPMSPAAVADLSGAVVAVIGAHVTTPRQGDDPADGRLVPCPHRAGRRTPEPATLVPAAGRGPRPWLLTRQLRGPSAGGPRPEAASAGTPRTANAGCGSINTVEGACPTAVDGREMPRIGNLGAVTLAGLPSAGVATQGE